MKSTFTKPQKWRSATLKSLLTTTLGFACLTGFSQTSTFNYTGGVQTYTVPACVTSVVINTYGAAGGGGYNGAQVTATVTVTPG